MSKNMAADWEQGVAATNQDKYCRKQVQDYGLSPQACAQRFANWQADIQGKSQKFVTRWRESG